MELEQRQADLLQGLIAEYIRTGKPVGSEYLAQALELNVSSATIRNDLRELEEAGYISQPHTSAGRIPTDQGYRFYVNHLVAKDISTRQREAMEKRFEEMNVTYQRPSRAIAKLLSELSHSLAISGWLKAHDVQEAGLPHIFIQPEGRAEALQEIAHLLENVDMYLRKLSQEQHGQDATTVYIGSENPVFDAVHTSSLVRTVELPSGETVVLLVVGPKRMPYQRNVSLLNSVASILEEESL